MYCLSMCLLLQVGVTNGEDVEVLALAATKPDTVPSGISCTSYTYTLAKEMTATVVVKAVYTEVLRPYPTEKAVSEPQRLALHASLHVLSPYKALNQSTTLELGNGKVESYAKHQPSSKKGSKIVYGPYTDILPFSSAESINGEPFTLRKLRRAVVDDFPADLVSCAPFCHDMQKHLFDVSYSRICFSCWGKSL